MPDATPLPPPSTREAVLKTLEVQRGKIERWKRDRIRGIEQEGDRELADLDRALRALDGESRAAGTRSGRVKSEGGRSPAALAAKRREAVVRLLEESSEGASIAEIARRLRFTEFSTRSALRRLVKEGSVRRLGSGTATRYESRRARRSASGMADPAGTLEGRVLGLIRDRASASLEELAQATGAPADEVRRVCGGLVAEGEIRMARRDGHPVYTAPRAA